MRHNSRDSRGRFCKTTPILRVGVDRVRGCSSPRATPTQKQARSMPVHTLPTYRWLGVLAWVLVMVAGCYKAFV